VEHFGLKGEELAGGGNELRGWELVICALYQMVLG
jgi:hypothetical protein